MTDPCRRLYLYMDKILYRYQSSMTDSISTSEISPDFLIKYSIQNPGDVILYPTISDMVDISDGPTFPIYGILILLDIF